MSVFALSFFKSLMRKRVGSGLHVHGESNWSRWYSFTHWQCRDVWNVTFLAVNGRIFLTCHREAALYGPTAHREAALYGPTAHREAALYGPTAHLEAALYGPTAHLEAIEGSIVFEWQNVIRDGEEISLSSNQTPDVDGLSYVGKVKNVTQRFTYM
jgi:hypothetical protein